ncbi:hypothetical protein FXO38_35321 [Capsicum annuum]|nr:hypothetical protein FXO38_35321 [Capsicum annuum]
MALLSPAEPLRSSDIYPQGRHACIRSPHKASPIHLPYISPHLQNNSGLGNRISEEQLRWAYAIIFQAQSGILIKVSDMMTLSASTTQSVALPSNPNTGESIVAANSSRFEGLFIALVQR